MTVGQWLQQLKIDDVRSAFDAWLVGSVIALIIIGSVMWLAERRRRKLMRKMYPSLYTAIKGGKR